MSYSEENTSSKEVEFDHLIDGTKVYGASKFGLDEHIEHIIKGGWPRLCALDYLKAGMAVEKYVDSIVNADFKKISGKSNSKTTEKIMNAISRNLLTHASIEKIAEEAYINTKTLSRYTKLLSDINVLEYVDAWKPHIRSSIRINMKPK
jgi:predicted AAA+ superfamily ATPase